MRWALLLVLATALPAAGAPGPFRVLDLGPRGRITQRAYDDLDGDGAREILLFANKRLSLFRPDGEGGYGTKPSQELDLDPEALVFDVGQVDGNKKTRELVLVTPRGVSYHAFQDGKLSPVPRRLLSARSLVTRGQADDLHWRGFLRDLDLNGLPDVVLATLEGFAVFYQAEPGRWPEKPEALAPYTLRATLDVDPPGLTGRVRGTLGVPDLHVADMTGDGRPDLVVSDGRTLRVFGAGEDGKLEGPAAEVDLAPLANADGTLPALVIRDVNGDAAPDFVVTRKRQGVTEVFLAGKPLDEPACRVKIPGWSFDPRLTDLDGDGRPDLIVPTTPEIGYLTAVSVAVTHAISVVSYVFLNTGDAEVPFGKQPTLRREIRVDVRLYVDVTGNLRAAHSVLVDFDGDFDGDGRKDLLVREGSDELLLFPGVEKGVFASSAALEIEIPDTEGYAEVRSVVRELNGDGRPDVALFYRSSDRQGDRVVLILTERDRGK